MEAAVAAFKLEGCWTWKHLLNGKQVSTGHAIGLLFEACMVDPRPCSGASVWALQDRVDASCQ